jgi:hypothetical protein
LKSERRPNRRTSSETHKLVRRALELLAKARTVGLKRQQDIWQYAVERDELLGLGLTGTDLRDLIRKGLVDHGREVITPSQSHRTFEKLNNLSLGTRSCFVLSEQGLHELNRERSRRSDPKAPLAHSQKPKWHARNRKLWYLRRLVKWYRVPADNQEQILAAFQREHWAPVIHYPLTRKEGLVNKHRLQEAIKSLNRHQINRLIRFRGTGDGTGVLWEPVTSPPKHRQ